ncbi:hypothetical protein ACVWYP_003388 [Bradyrhizobium sp. USDA 3262]
MTLLLTHSACLDHLTPPGHPERPDRLRAVAEVLGEDRFKALVRDSAPEGDLDTVLLCHGEHYVSELRHIAPTSGMIYIDGDTSMSPGTWEAVMRGVGGAVAATDAVMEGKHQNAFVAVRPPGHHAEKSTPMGFCFFDNAAIAARHAQRKYGIKRAAIIDFDVHHGNGTQDIFWADPTVMYCSTHQMPLFTRHRGRRRARRARHRRQRAAGARRRRRQVPLRFREPDPAATREVLPRTRRHLGGLRRASPRSPGLDQPDGRGFRLGHAQADGSRRQERRRPRRLRPGRRLRPAGPERVGGISRHRIDGRVNPRHNTPAKIRLILRRGEHGLRQVMFGRQDQVAI